MKSKWRRGLAHAWLGQKGNVKDKLDTIEVSAIEPDTVMLECRGKFRAILTRDQAYELGVNLKNSAQSLAGTPPNHKGTVRTEKEQRIAIAEACGWSVVCDPGFPSETVFHQEGRFEFETDLPNYLHDLNAMHAALETLTDEEIADFGYELERVISRSTFEGPCRSFAARKFLAKAGQLAETFLRVKKLWRD